MKKCDNCGGNYWDTSTGGKLPGEELLRRELNLARAILKEYLKPKEEQDPEIIGLNRG